MPYDELRRIFEEIGTDRPPQTVFHRSSFKIREVALAAMRRIAIAESSSKASAWSGHPPHGGIDVEGFTSPDGHIGIARAHPTCEARSDASAIVTKDSRHVLGGIDHKDSSDANRARSGDCRKPAMDIYFLFQLFLLTT
ncbi:hypothetical protein [Ensifer adhaerens]|uniref:hypothetical protein n=1 Tax=Ensifer adhaerens TaxID=106592 RepID=UPI00131A0A5D|nr:hypothetical protein [Ensifer adhaerens]